MRILDSNEYINEKLDIKPVTKTRLDDLREPIVNEKIREFIKDYNLEWNPITKRYDCNHGSVDISLLSNSDLIVNGRFAIKFGNVAGSFECNGCNLKSLEGAPQKVGNGFCCHRNKLKSLNGAPKKVGYDFRCFENELESLVGAPQEVGGDFVCCDNKLTSLEGAPKKVGGGFSCSHNKLTTLEGAPKEVGGDFDCSNNPNLVLPEEKPIWVKGEIIS